MYQIKLLNMKTLQKLLSPELTQLLDEYNQQFKELLWKKAKTQRSLEKMQEKKNFYAQKLQQEEKRLESNRRALEIFEESHPLKKKIMEDLFKTHYRIQQLKARQGKYSTVKELLLELKLRKTIAEINLLTEQIDALEAEILRRNQAGVKRIFPEKPAHVLLNDQEISGWILEDIQPKAHKFYLLPPSFVF